MLFLLFLPYIYYIISFLYVNLLIWKIPLISLLASSRSVPSSSHRPSLFDPAAASAAPVCGWWAFRPSLQIHKEHDSQVNFRRALYVFADDGTLNKKIALCDHKAIQKERIKKYIWKTMSLLYLNSLFIQFSPYKIF